MLAFQDYSPAKILQQNDTSLNQTTFPVFQWFLAILRKADNLPYLGWYHSTTGKKNNKN